MLHSKSEKLKNKNVPSIVLAHYKAVIEVILRTLRIVARQRFVPLHTRKINLRGELGDDAEETLHPRRFIMDASPHDEELVDDLVAIMVGPGIEHPLKFHEEPLLVFISVAQRHGPDPRLGGSLTWRPSTGWSSCGGACCSAGGGVGLGGMRAAVNWAEIALAW